MASAIKSAAKTEEFQVKIEPTFSGVKPSLIITPAQTPQVSPSKPSLDQLSRSKSGRKIGQEESVRNMRIIPINAFNDTPEIKQHEPHVQCYDCITMGIFHIGSTITRVRICLRVLLFCIKIFSILTAAVFWITAPFYLISLVNWQLPWKLIYLTSTYFGGRPVADHILKILFPDVGSGGYHLRLAIHASLYSQSPAIYSMTLPILIDRSMALFFLLAFMFIGHHLLCFAHDCLTKFGRTIRTKGDN
jgi:hypothetical protein